MQSTGKASERITERIQTLSDLHRRGIVQGSLFRKQIHSLLSSKDARAIFKARIEPDRKVIKILNRLENPAGWREISMKSREHREESFYRAIEEIMNGREPGDEKLTRMLQLCCLPFYAGFLPLGSQDRESPRDQRPSRVSVLD
ncbi:MAG TPA: hypothetical protein PLM22_02520 [Candidatus Sabulitectum sp.]|nr:hypothetical protein [Candidatus Sabulitectum sp.]HPF31759.1 hypothetical protein [Candidatus Sabulitectum sp.]HPJ27779.1 hypothetical protein [Candidatus Sabulitectum sp.]HPR21677.1 hypothetical protein [Candidatus Sabulitectum sp.]